MMPKVIYIAAQAFSGSTFFCALLGTHSDMEPVSELSKWTVRYNESNRLCACGKPDKKCEFWLAVERKWLGSIGSEKIARYGKLQQRFESINSLLSTNWNRDIKETEDFREFEDMTVSLFRTISEISDRSTIVDSSKIPGRAFALSKMKGLDLSIIHLVRNHLRYLESILNRGNKISLDDANLLYKTFRLGIRWSTTNYAAELAFKRSGVKGLRIRYEDLVSKPVNVLDNIGSTLDVDVTEIKKYVGENLPVSFQHMATGSGYRNRGPKPITGKYAEAEGIEGSLKFAFCLGSAILSRRYGYW